MLFTETRTRCNMHAEDVHLQTTVLIKLFYYTHTYVSYFTLKQTSTSEFVCGISAWHAPFTYLIRMRHCGTVLLQSSSLEGMACLISNMSMCLLLVSYLETSYGLIRSLRFAFEPASLSISPHSRCSLTPKTVRSPQPYAIFLPSSLSASRSPDEKVLWQASLVLAFWFRSTKSWLQPLFNRAVL